MNHDQLFEQIKNRLGQFSLLHVNNEIDLITSLEISSKATEEEIKRVDSFFDFNIPEQLKTLFKEFAKEVKFDYQFDKEFEKPFDGIFSGGLNWNLDGLYAMYTNYIGWTESWLDPSMEYDEGEYKKQEKLVLNKIPLSEVPNGDLIVMDIETSRVTYLSHECGEMHGKTLGKDLFNYLDFLQSVWFIGNEDWQFEPFYNFEIDCTEKNGVNSEKWRNIVEKGL